MAVPAPDDDEGEVLNAAIRSARHHRLAVEFFNPPPMVSTVAHDLAVRLQRLQLLAAAWSAAS